MPNEKFFPPFTTSKSLSPKLVWYNHKIKLKFERSWLKEKDKAAFTPKNVASFFTVYELDAWPQDLNTDFTLGSCLFGAVTLKMLIQINTHIVIMALDSILVDIILYLTVA